MSPTTSSGPKSDFSQTQPPRPEWLERGFVEEPIAADMPIIDPHMHLWDRGSGNRYFVEEYAADVATTGRDIEATIYVECRSMYRADGPEHLKSVGETEFAAGMAAIAASERYTRTKVAAGIVSHADMRSDRLEEILGAHALAAGGRLRGIRQGAKWDADPKVFRGPAGSTGGLYLDPATHRGVAMVAAHGLLFECSVFHPQISDVATLARAVPEASIVLIHTGSPVQHGSYADRAGEAREHWLAAMSDLARCPNVTVKLGGLLMSLGNFDFVDASRPPTSAELARLWRGFIDPCLDLFGADRCMASSNFPVEKAGVSYATIWNAFTLMIANASQAEQRAIMADTARRIYRL